MPPTKKSSAAGAFEPVTYRKLSVVVPVFNERNTVGEIVRRMRLVELPGSLDLVLVQDADLEYDPEDWPRLLHPIMRGRALVVYGSRFTGERRNMLFLHW